MKMKIKRIKWLDFAKGFTIFCVVLLHSIVFVHITTPFLISKAIHFFVYLLHIFIMPIFFAISGYLYKPTNTLKKYSILLYKKLGSFIIPYILCNIVVIYLQHVNSFIYILKKYWYKILILPSSWLWFLFALFFIFIFVGIFDLFHVPFYVQFLIYLILATFSQIRTPIKVIIQNDILNINPLLGATNPIVGAESYFICFYIGFLIKHFNLIKYLKNKCVTFNLFILWSLLIILQRIIVTHYGDINMFTYYDMNTKLLSIFVFFSIFINISSKNFLFKYFTKYGKYTLAIYLIHYPVITFISPFFYKEINLLHIPMMMLSFNIIIAWSISIIICQLSTKFKIINFVFYPRKYIDRLINKTYFSKFLNI